MTKSEASNPPEALETREQRARLRSWLFAISAIAAWLLLATNSADAQEVRVPDFVLAQVLGEAAPAPSPGSAGQVNLVAQQMRQNFQDQLVAGVTRPSVELEVHFDWDSDAIHDKSDPQIEAAAEVLNRHFPETRFRVAGFADPSGEERYNQQLSERRADAVYRRLVEEHGVSAERLERVGFGEEDPMAEASDAQRRRVELQILRGEGEPL